MGSTSLNKPLPFPSCFSRTDTSLESPTVPSLPIYQTTPPSFHVSLPPSPTASITTHRLNFGNPIYTSHFNLHCQLHHFILTSISSSSSDNSRFHCVSFEICYVNHIFLPKAMTPAPFHSKREIINNPHNHAFRSPPLKVHKDSHSVKKPPPPSLLSSSSTSSSGSSTIVSAGSKPQQRQPVIIYTHTPKIIHTHPSNFMALVQKLTGLSRSDNDFPAASDLLQPKQEQGSPAASTLTIDREGGDFKKGLVNEDNETSSVITEENNCSSSIGDTQVNSCFMPNPPMLDPQLNPYMTTNLPVFASSNSAEFLFSNNQPFLNYDPLFFPHNMRSSMNNTSNATLEGMNDFREY